MLDTMFKICCILIWLLFTFILEQEDINNIKKEAYREFANRLKNKSLTKWDYNDAVDIEEIDKTLIELIRSIM